MIWELKCADGSGANALAATTAANPMTMTIASGTECQLKVMHPSMQQNPYPGWSDVFWHGFGVNLTVPLGGYEATLTFSIPGGLAQPPSAPDPPSLPPASPTFENCFVYERSTDHPTYCYSGEIPYSYVKTLGMLNAFFAYTMVYCQFNLLAIAQTVRRRRDFAHRTPTLSPSTTRCHNSRPLSPLPPPDATTHAT